MYTKISAASLNFSLFSLLACCSLNAEEERVTEKTPRKAEMAPLSYREPLEVYPMVVEMVDNSAKMDAALLKKYPAEIKKAGWLDNGVVMFPPKMKIGKNNDFLELGHEKFKRHVIVLPKLENEKDLEVEISVGSNITGDGVNLHSVNTRIFTVPAQSSHFGLTYYKVTATTSYSTTKMQEIDPVTKKPIHRTVERFISGQTIRVPYKSGEPLVFYVGAGSVIKHRVIK